MKTTEVLERIVEQLQGIREELIRLTEAIQDTSPNNLSGREQIYLYQLRRKEKL